MVLGKFPAENTSLYHLTFAFYPNLSTLLAVSDCYQKFPKIQMLYQRNSKINET